MDKTKNDGGPIAPDMVLLQKSGDDYVLETRMTAVGGLTIRDWFAGMAMQGLLYKTLAPASFIAKDAYMLADAMLAARKDTP